MIVILFKQTEKQPVLSNDSSEGNMSTHKGMGAYSCIVKEIKPLPCYRAVLIVV